jgi:hypothetical protein
MLLRRSLACREGGGAPVAYGIHISGNRTNQMGLCLWRSVSLLCQAAEFLEDAALGIVVQIMACSSGKVHVQGVDFLCSRVAE